MSFLISSIWLWTLWKYHRGTGIIDNTSGDNDVELDATNEKTEEETAMDTELNVDNEDNE